MGFPQLNRAIGAMGLAMWLTPTLAQHWEPAGVPSFIAAPYICYTDTVRDVMIAAGDHSIVVDSVSYTPLYEYASGQWDTLGLFGNSLRAAVTYNDTLIVGGAFHSVGDQPIARISCFADGVWKPYGSITDVQNAGEVSRLRVVNGVLYALGTFDNADGVFCNGIAKRVGGRWEAVGSLPTFNGDGSAWFIDAVHFQGRLVVTGNFTSVDQTIHDVMAYDGISWDPICEGLTGGFDSGGILAVYQDNLYLGGRYYFGPGTPGQGLMRWDGDLWYAVGQLGGGLQLYNYSDQYPPTIYDFSVRDGLLFVAGAFGFADHVPATGIATWDGSQWCSLGGSLDFGVSRMAFYHDTLYVGCGPNADGQLVNGVARFIGSSYEEECAPTAVAEVMPAHGFGILPQGSGGVILTGLADGSHVVQVLDVQGRLLSTRSLRSQSGRSEEMLLRQQSNALYIIRIDGQFAAKYIPDL